MKLINITACFSALLLMSSVQIATAADHHRPHKSRTACVISKWPRDANASISISTAPAVSEPTYYSGGWSAPAGR